MRERHEMDRRLGALPRERAGANFTARVLARIGEAESQGSVRARRPAARGGLWLPLLLTGAALAFAFGIGVWQQGQRSKLAREIAELRRDHARLGAELRRLRAGLREQPLLYLGGDDRVDYVIDLGRVARAAGPPLPAEPGVGEAL